MKTTKWRDAQASRLATMSEDDRAEYDAAYADAELGIRLAEMVYDARIAAGLSQAELARRMGTQQSVISQIEGGGQIPGVAMLNRVARATGQRLEISLAAAR